jgi:drug/metabolite transporter (DMT)-like permease
MKLMTIFLVLLTNVFFAASSILIKLAVDKMGKLDFSSFKIFVVTVQRFLCSPLYIAGVGVAILGSAAYYLMLSRLNLSIAYPLLSLAYIFVAFGSIAFCKETININVWVGTLFICIGIALVTVKGH